MNPWIWLAVLAGALIPIQSGVNASLRQPLGSAMLAALVSFTSGTIALILCCIALKTSIPPASALQTIRPWAWFVGGLCGAMFVTSNVLLTPKLGIGTFLVATIASQLVLSSIFDHFGAFNTPIHPLTTPRLIGVGLLVVGAYLVKRF